MNHLFSFSKWSGFIADHAIQPPRFDNPEWPALPSLPWQVIVISIFILSPLSAVSK